MIRIAKKVYWKIRWILSLDIVKYFYYNFLCKQIERERGTRLIPYKGAVIELHKTSKLIIKGQNLEIGINKLAHSKAETYLKLMTGAVWNCNNGVKLCYNATIEVHENAAFESGYFFMNTGSVVICTKRICLGEDILIGRDNVIYDSDFHKMLDQEGNVTNYPQDVSIGNHVWLTNHVMVQKGVTIGEGAVISPFTILRKDVLADELIANGTEQLCVANNIYWSSEKI